MDKRVKDLDQFKPGNRIQLSSTEEIIATADRSDDGGAALAKYGTVDVEPEGDNPTLVKVYNRDQGENCILLCSAWCFGVSEPAK